jgi:HAD superfamily hydrolase (TIGR01484 family)
MVKLVGLDIDGTLIPPAHYGDGEQLPNARVTAAVQRLTAVGIVVVLASGRMFPGTARIARHLGLEQPVICQQGCSVHLLDGTALHQFPIPVDCALDIVGFARDLGHPYEWFNPVRYLVSRHCPSAEEYARVSGVGVEVVEQPEFSGVPATGVGIISTPEEANGIHQEVNRRHAESLHVLDFPEVTVAVAASANKGHALSLICDDLGIGRHEVLAIGDSVNDAPMLAWAGRGIALAHSDRYALDAAGELLPDGPDALAELLESLVR